MRRMAGLTVLAGLAAVLATGCGVRSTAAGASPAAPASAASRTGQPRAAVTRATGDVPWTGRVAPVYTPPPPPAPPPSPVAEYAECAAGQLTGRVRNDAPTMGSVTTTFVLTNASTRPCTLAGPPSSATGFGPDGARQALPVRAMDGWGSLVGPPVNLRPGQSAQALTVSAYPGECSPGSAYTFTALAIGVGRTGAVRVSFPGSRPLILAGCGTNGLRAISVRGFGVPAPSDTPPPSPLHVLTVTRSMPRSVAPGSIVHFTVTLANPTGHAVPLSPCPSYAEDMTIVGPAAARALRHPYVYYLNCRAAPDIPAHGAVTFDMEIPAPLGAGQAKYSWSLQVSDLGTGGVTQIVRLGSRDGANP